MTERSGAGDLARIRKPALISRCSSTHAPSPRDIELLTQEELRLV